MDFSFYLHAYGCQMNVYDGECLIELLQGAGGHQEVLTNADVAILLGCSVRASAENRLWGNITQLKKWKEEKKGRIIALGGCTGEREADNLLERFPHVDLVFGTGSLLQVSKLLEQARQKERVSYCGSKDYNARGNKTGICAFVAVMRGCDNHCSYCVVPGARGAERSRDVDSILAEVEARLFAGTKEVILVGQNVNSYQKAGINFAGLIKLVAQTGIPRIRFTTNHPNDLSEELIRTMAEFPNVCPSLHLPAQSGSDSILARMNRKYTLEQYLARVRLARSILPMIGLTTDLMVGFPGETEDDFAATLGLSEQVRFDAAFLFKYNPRPGTKAYSWQDDVLPSIKQERLMRLIRLQEGITWEINQTLEGGLEEVLVEGRARKGGWRGRIGRGQVVNFIGQASLGDITMVRIISGKGHTLKGAVLSD